MGEIRQLSFQIEGSFITDIARTWFWDENRPYSVCEELLLNCLVTDQIDDATKKTLAVEILEGRKKLEGCNVFYLVDDNERVRPLSQKIEQMEYEAGLARIKEDMELNAINYVDPYSTLRSIKALRESQTRKSNTFEDVFNFFAHSPRDGEYDERYEIQSTKLGLWLFFYPEIAWKATNKGFEKVGTDRFWENIYQLVKDWDFDQFFIERNERYLAQGRVDSLSKETINQVVERGIKDLEQTVESTDLDSEKGFIARVSLDSLDGEVGEDRLLHVTVPDDIVKWEGLISPTGDFYSCTFGGHNLKAYNILMAYPEKFSKMERVHMDSALDNLMEFGWCATRFLPFRGEYLEIPPESSGKRVTKAQKDKIWEAIVKHDAHPDNMYLIGY